MSVHPGVELQVGKLLAMAIGQTAAASAIIREYDREDRDELADRLWAAAQEIEAVYEILCPMESPEKEQEYGKPL